MKTPSRNDSIQYPFSLNLEYQNSHGDENFINTRHQEIEEQATITEADKHIEKCQENLFAGLREEQIRAKQINKSQQKNKSTRKVAQSTHTPPHAIQVNDKTEQPTDSLLNNDKELEIIDQVSQQLDDTAEVATLLHKLYKHIEGTPHLAEKSALREENKWSNQQQKLERKANQQLKKINKKWLHIDTQYNTLLKAQAAIKAEAKKSSWFHSANIDRRA